MPKAIKVKYLNVFIVESRMEFISLHFNENIKTSLEVIPRAVQHAGFGTKRKSKKGVSMRSRAGLSDEAKILDAMVTRPSEQDKINFFIKIMGEFISKDASVKQINLALLITSEKSKGVITKMLDDKSIAHTVSDEGVLIPSKAFATFSAIANFVGETFTAILYQKADAYNRERLFATKTTPSTAITTLTPTLGK
jgi:hypothetical protein